MKYSTLIRKLLKASSDSRHKGSDIAMRLRERCVDGIDIVRMTLMNAVCDPRFKIHVCGFPAWKALAQQQLEAFATQLMSIPDLTEEKAMFCMDDMLTSWYEKAVAISSEYDSQSAKFVSLPKDKNSQSYETIRNALKEFIEGKTVNDNDEDAPAFATETDNDENKSTDKNQNEQNEDRAAADNSDDVDSLLEQQDYPSLKNIEDSPWGNRIAKGLEIKENTRIENNFLNRVPPSLIRLAKIIGRASDGIMNTGGSFSVASKSDIAGITTGNNLESLLPSELALLSDSKTENIFYKRYVTKDLQIFASKSSASKGKKHRNGPIIICLDTSSSMRGDPIIVATALTMAICIIGQRSKRPVLVVRYSNGHTLFRLRNISEEKKELAEFLNHIEMRGNNENNLFNWLFTDILPKEKSYDCADILCISDFGWTRITPKVYDLIKNEKENGMVFYGLMTNDTFAPISSERDNDGYKGPENVIDHLWEFSNGACRKTSKMKTDNH